MLMVLALTLMMSPMLKLMVAIGGIEWGIKNVESSLPFCAGAYVMWLETSLPFLRMHICAGCLHVFLKFNSQLLLWLQIFCDRLRLKLRMITPGA